MESAGPLIKVQPTRGAWHLGARKAGAWNSAAPNTRAIRLTWLLCGLAAWATGCSKVFDFEDPDPGGSITALDELERMVLIPAIPNRLYGTGIFEDLLIDRFEATRGDWQRVFGSPPSSGAFLVDAAQTDRSRLDWPAFCSLIEAREFASRRGMRLPTESEWRYVAGGPTSHRYPWGRARSESLSNTLHLNLGRPLPVGCFERGRSAFGCYDMSGNVREWVEASSRLDLPATGLALGDSYLTWLHELAEPGGRHLLEERTRTPDLGVRCAVEARAWLGERLDELAGSPGSPARLQAIGREFGSAGVLLLSQLKEEHPDSPALQALLKGADR